MLPIKRLLFALANSYLDDSNGAAVASRAMLESLVRSGFAVEALSGTTVGTGEDLEPAAYLSARGIAHEQVGGGAWQADARGVRAESIRHYRLIFRGVPLTLYGGTGTKPNMRDDVWCGEFLRLFRRSAEQVPPGHPRELWRRPAGSRDQITGRVRGVAAVFRTP